MKSRFFLFFFLFFLLTFLFFYSSESVLADDSGGFSADFAGVGSDYITFRSYFYLRVFDDDADPFHEHPIDLIEFTKASGGNSIEGLYHIEYGGNRFISYNNKGNYCAVDWNKDIEKVLSAYLTNRYDGTVEHFHVNLETRIKVFSRTGSIGPYNSDFDQNCYWDSLTDCEEADWSVLADGGKGKDRYGNVLEGYYRLSEDQIANIEEIFFDAVQFSCDVSSTGINYKLTYDCNGGKFPKSGNDYDGETIIDTTFSSLTGATIIDAIPEYPTRNSAYFWGWCKEKYAFNKGPTEEYIYYMPGDNVRSFTGKTTLYAIWGSCPFEDVSDHIHDYNRTRINTGTCPYCGAKLYEYVYECRYCGDTNGDGTPIKHVCPDNSLGIRNGDCEVCHDVEADSVMWIYGNNISLELPANYDLSDVPGHSFIYYSTACDGSGDIYYPGDVFSFRGVAECRVLYAIYTPDIFTVIFDLNRDLLYGDVTITEVPDSMRVSYDDTGSVLPEPECDRGYLFYGWFDEKTGRTIKHDDRCMITNDTMLSAVFKPKRHIVTFDVSAPPDALNVAGDHMDKRYGWEESIGYGSRYYESCSAFRLPSCIGYDFAGWYVSDREHIEYIDENTVFTAEHDVCLIGMWKRREFSLTLDPLDGRLEGCEVGEKITISFSYNDITAGAKELPKALKTGYDFLGWRTGTNTDDAVISNGENLKIDHDMTLFAVYGPRRFRVTFDYSDEWKYDAIDITGNEIKEADMTFGEKITDLPSPKRYGYIFKGWSVSNRSYPEYNATNGDGTADIIENGKIWAYACDMRLFAVWEPVAVNVRYDFNYDYTETYPLPDHGG